MPFIYVLIGGLLTLFLESFFVALCNFRIFYMIVLVLFKRIDWRYLLIFTFLTSLVSDVVYHYVFGTSLLTITLPLLLIWGTSFLIPIDNTLPGYVVKFVSFVLYYFLQYVIPSLFSTGVFAHISLVAWAFILLKSVISLGVCIIVDIVTKRIRKKEESGKLILR